MLDLIVFYFFAALAIISAILVVTHYQRLLNYIVPDKVHVLVDGRIVRSGGPELALQLEETGYAGHEPAVRASASPA